MAWAWGGLLDADEAETQLVRHGGVLYRPSKTTAGKSVLPCPEQGSLASLERRFEAGQSRFTWTKYGKKNQQLFSQPPKPRFATIAYDTPSHRFLFDLRVATRDESFAPWPPTKTAELVVALRDKAAGRLKEAMPEEAGKIDRVLIGRRATEADKAIRARILPLLSIGHSHADGAIRRVLVEIPPNCPLRSDDLAWALSGLSEIDSETGEILWSLVRSNEHGMLKHYGIDVSGRRGFRVWRTVTPAALTFTRKSAKRPAQDVLLGNPRSPVRSCGLCATRGYEFLLPIFLCNASRLIALAGAPKHSLPTRDLPRTLCGM